jgi:hypothetical protein
VVLARGALQDDGAVVQAHGRQRVARPGAQFGDDSDNRMSGDDRHNTVFGGGGSDDVGGGYGDDFLAGLESAVGGNSHLVTLALGIIFPIVHSGLASLRPYAEPIVGARAWRVVFAFPSLCLSYTWITYFISHAHDGLVWWDGEQSALAHTLAWGVSFLSFFFLYPSVFNLKDDVLLIWRTSLRFSFCVSNDDFKLAMMNRENLKHEKTLNPRHSTSFLKLI